MARISRIRNHLNPRRVIFWMTVGVFIILGWLMIAVFDGLPPWPVVACFTISHVFFCIVVSQVRPYKGPHTEPMSERTTKDWDDAEPTQRRWNS